jgi:hypothetical protein
VDRAELVVLGTVSDVIFDGPVNEVANRHEPNVVVSQSEVTGRVVIQVEAFLKGWAPEVVVGQGHVAVWRDSAGQIKTEFSVPGCAYFRGVPVGERHLLFLNRNEAGLWGTSGCSWSHEVHPTSDPEPYARYNEFYTKYLADLDGVFGLPPGSLEAAANTSGPVSLPGGGGSSGDQRDFPRTTAAVWAVSGSLAFLLGAAFLWRRREPHNG